MPTQQQYQNTILSAGLLLANNVKANGDDEAAGFSGIDWCDALALYLNIEAAQDCYNLGDYVSANAVSIYDCLNTLIGFDNAINVIDPNYQPPTGNIIVTPPAAGLQPMDIGYNDFDPVTQQPDFGRIRYYNSNWLNINPMIQIAAPGMTALFLGQDYILLSGGGIQLLPTGNLPEIYTGQILRITGYETI